MAWVRLHDGAMTHPKIIGLSDKAFRLWVWGLSYCQLHLTDGVIPPVAIPGRMKRATDDLVKAVLWHLEGDGYSVHDYLSWNDSKDVIVRKRSDARERMEHARDKRSRELLSRTPLTEVLRGVGSSKAFTGKIVEDDIGERAARFLERYEALYSQYRHGARVLIKPSLDWDRACELCRKWDSARLEKLATVFLTTDDDWISRTDRGFGVFHSKASWADDRLAAAEQAAS